MQQCVMAIVGFFTPYIVFSKISKKFDCIYDNSQQSYPSSQSKENRVASWFSVVLRIYISFIHIQVQ